MNKRLRQIYVNVLIIICYLYICFKEQTKVITVWVFSVDI